MSTRSVEPGQRYRARKAWTYVWEVDSIMVDREGHEHAKLHAVNDVKEYRTIACTVLLDRERYEFVGYSEG
jgi:hypothetical protein